MTSAFKSIKDIDCRVVRERDGRVSVMLGYPMENLAQMFSDMLEEPIENVRGWLRRELVPMTIEDLERLALVVNKALEVAKMVKVAQDYSVTVQDADCDCVEAFSEVLPLEPSEEDYAENDPPHGTFEGEE